MENKELHTEIAYLFTSYFKENIERYEEIPASGSTRSYYRIYSKLPFTVIAAYGADVAENNSFIYFAQYFHMHGLHVPHVYTFNKSRTIYLQSDVGSIDVLTYKKACDEQEQRSIYKRIIRDLLNFQFVGAEADFSYCFVRNVFDRQAMKWDLAYFKYYYLKLSGSECNDQKLEEDFDTLISFLEQADASYFMFRDFQARNILIDSRKRLSYIDFQGGMKGPLQYDLASLLFQAKADLSDTMREELLHYYCNELQKRVEFDVDEFISHFYGFVFIRMLQTLGAYGYRGLIEKKEHFVTSIPFAVENVKTYAKKLPQTLYIPYLNSLLRNLPTITEI